MGRYRLVQNRQIISPDFLYKTCPCFPENLPTFSGKYGHVFFVHRKILSIIRTFFRSSAQHTFSANRQDIYFPLASIAYIFHSLAQQRTFPAFRQDTKKGPGNLTTSEPRYAKIQNIILMLLLLPNPERWLPERQHLHPSIEKAVILFYPCRCSVHCLRGLV